MTNLIHRDTVSGCNGPWQIREVISGFFRGSTYSHVATEGSGGCSSDPGVREQRIPALDTPETVTKNQEARVVVLNDIAQSIVEEVRGQHPTHVFTWLNRKGRRRPLTRLTNSGWRAARRRAPAR
jgi:hypothetical protein